MPLSASLGGMHWKFQSYTRTLLPLMLESSAIGFPFWATTRVGVEGFRFYGSGTKSLSADRRFPHLKNHTDILYRTACLGWKYEPYGHRTIFAPDVTVLDIVMNPSGGSSSLRDAAHQSRCEDYFYQRTLHGEGRHGSHLGWSIRPENGCRQGTGANNQTTSERRNSASLSCRSVLDSFLVLKRSVSNAANFLGVSGSDSFCCQ